MAGIAEMLTELVKTYKAISGAEVLFPSGREVIGKCPRCGSALLVVALLLVLAGGGALYWFKLRKPKPQTKGPADLDDYDYGEDDEEYENEDEPEETEVADE